MLDWLIPNNGVVTIVEVPRLSSAPVAVSVDVATIDGTAVGGADFTALSTTAEIPLDGCRPASSMPQAQPHSTPDSEV